MASIVEVHDQTGSCHLCNHPVESEGVYHDGAARGCLAHKVCLLNLNEGDHCANCQISLDKISYQNNLQLDSLEGRKIVDLAADEELARKLQGEEEQGIRGIEHPEDAELARKLQEEESSEVRTEFPVIHFPDEVDLPVQENRGSIALAPFFIAGVVAALSYLNAS